MIKQTQTILRLLPTNCLSVFDHFVGFARKGLETQVFPNKTSLTILYHFYFFFFFFHFFMANYKITSAKGKVRFLLPTFICINSDRFPKSSYYENICLKLKVQSEN